MERNNRSGDSETLEQQICTACSQINSAYMIVNDAGWNGFDEC
jgi:hypothetical protein